MKFAQTFTVCSMAQYKTFAAKMLLHFASSHFIIIVYIQYTWTVEVSYPPSCKIHIQVPVLICYCVYQSSFICQLVSYDIVT